MARESRARGGMAWNETGLGGARVMDERRNKAVAGAPSRLYSGVKAGPTISLSRSLAHSLPVRLIPPSSCSG